MGAMAIASKDLFAKDANPKNLPPNVPEWTAELGDGVDANPYGVPSEFEKNVIRRNVEWLTASTQSSVNFTPIHDLEGIVTPNGLCFERHHGGVSIIDPKDYRLMINGLVDREMIFTLEDLKRFPQTNKFYFLDWEYASLNHPCFDLASLVHTYKLDLNQVHDLSIGYGGDKELFKMDRLEHWIEFIHYLDEIWKISVNVILEQMPGEPD